MVRAFLIQEEGEQEKERKKREEKEMEEKLVITFNKLLRDRLQKLPGFHSSCTNVHIPKHNLLPKAY